MNDEATRPPSKHHPPTLEYHSGRDDGAYKRVPALIAGIFCGGVLVLVAGFFASAATEHGEFEFHSIPAAVSFFAFAMAGVGLSIWKMTRGSRQWFVPGLLLGAGAMALIEGLCFASGS